MTTFEESNSKLYKEQADTRELALRKLVRNIIRLVPRNILIEVLKKEKVIKRLWAENGEEYGEK